MVWVAPPPAASLALLWEDGRVEAPSPGSWAFASTCTEAGVDLCPRFPLSRAWACQTAQRAGPTAFPEGLATSDTPGRAWEPQPWGAARGPRTTEAPLWLSQFPQWTLEGVMCTDLWLGVGRARTLAGPQRAAFQPAIASTCRAPRMQGAALPGFPLPEPDPALKCLFRKASPSPGGPSVPREKGQAGDRL